MVRGMHTGYNQTSCPPGGQPAYWKTTTSQKFPHKRVLNLTACSPTWRVWYQEEEGDIKPMGLEHRSSTGLRETDSTLGGCTQGLRCTETAKALTSGKPGPDLPAGLGQSSGEMGDNCSLPWGNRHWFQTYLGTFYFVNTETGGNEHLGSLAPRTGPTREPAVISANWVGTQPHPAAQAALRLPE